MDKPSTAYDTPRPFLSHLADLRRTLLQVLAVCALAMALVAPLSPWLLRLLKWPLRHAVTDPEGFLVSYEVAAGVLVLLRITFSAGLLLAAPWILFIIGKFVFPGLTLNERTVIRRYVGLAVVMFLVGGGFAFVVILPLALRMLLQMHQWMGIAVQHVLATNYIAFVTQLMLGFGLAFEMPVVLLVMGRLGIVNAAQLRAKRKHLIVTLLIVAMLMTPQDVVTQILMALPLYVLFEGCILLIARDKTNRKDPHE